MFNMIIINAKALSQILKAKTTGDKKEILSGLRNWYFYFHSMGHFDSTNAIFVLFLFQA